MEQSVFSFKKKLYNRDVGLFYVELFLVPGHCILPAHLIEIAEHLKRNYFPEKCSFRFFTYTKAPKGKSRSSTQRRDFKGKNWENFKKILNDEYYKFSSHAIVDGPEKYSIVLRTYSSTPNWQVESGHLWISIFLPYLEGEITVSADKTRGFIDFIKMIWELNHDGMLYAYGNIMEGASLPFEDDSKIGLQELREKWYPPRRAHAIPVAYYAHNLLPLCHKGKGILGAFWMNFLSKHYVDMLGGEEALRAKLEGLRVESLKGGGLMIITTDSPLPEDNEENREKFLRLHKALQPAFISLADIPEHYRYNWIQLGPFYRERHKIFVDDTYILHPLEEEYWKLTEEKFLQEKNRNK